ncbi:MAG: hypothetical protein IMW97_05540 [Firmicutes bacterium]|nr:hypothetical protein [Candidatus Fermentithermobacillaceae bacterium]
MRVAATYQRLPAGHEAAVYRSGESQMGRAASARVKTIRAANIGEQKQMRDLPLRPASAKPADCETTRLYQAPKSKSPVNSLENEAERMANIARSRSMDLAPPGGCPGSLNQSSRLQSNDDFERPAAGRPPGEFELGKKSREFPIETRWFSAKLAYEVNVTVRDDNLTLRKTGVDVTPPSGAWGPRAKFDWSKDKGGSFAVGIEYKADIKGTKTVSCAAGVVFGEGGNVWSAYGKGTAKNTVLDKGVPVKVEQSLEITLSQNPEQVRNSVVDVGTILLILGTVLGVGQTPSTPTQPAVPAPTIP